MPPRTRTAKTSKCLKENMGVVDKAKLKTNGKASKPGRKALADKTNSASDDNASIEIPKKVGKKLAPVTKSKKSEPDNDEQFRPRRERRLPNRFVENHVLSNLSNSKENASITPNSMAMESQSSPKNKSNVTSPFKTPQKDQLIAVTRSRRIHRLPSRFEDHSISPSKFIPVQPVHASTPIVPKSVSIMTKAAQKESNKLNGKIHNTAIPTQITVPSKTSPKKTVGASNTTKNSADTNNNAKQGRTLRNRVDNKVKTAKENMSPTKSKTGKKLTNKNSSFRVLEDKPTQDNNLDVYEFTYDPNEEPPPQKKKRKKVVRKKPTKPKVVNFKSNYDQNLSKTLTALKSAVSKKQTQQQIENTAQPQSNVKILSVETIRPATIVSSANTIAKSNLAVKNATAYSAPIESVANNASIQVEDIAADFEPVLDNHEMDYSPVNSPSRPKSPVTTLSNGTAEQPAPNNDPLNLQDDLSFFDENPVASSSINTSVRHPHASPWRVEFESLPIRWHVNSYVKPNMTPAVERSFVNFDDSKKKHVYTNMLPEIDDPVPVVESNTPNLKQTSIISFIKEMAEKTANKNKKKVRSVTPTRNAFDDIAKTNKTIVDGSKTTKTVVTPKKSPDENPTNNITPTDNSNDEINSVEMPNEDSNKENSVGSTRERKRKNDSDPNIVPAKTPRKDKDITFFGFDDSENQNSENVSPNKITKRPGLRSQRTVLKELNEQTGPTRAVLPLAAKSKALNSEVNKLYEEMKSASDAPVFPQKNPVENFEATNAYDLSLPEQVIDDNSESVHLFEDIELVHHLKPTRKSYGKAKKVTIRHVSDSSHESVVEAAARSSDEDDLADLTFEIPSVKQKKSKKKQTKKQKLSKKEEAEAEAWAAGFNSMCEDIEEFPLLLE